MCNYKIGDKVKFKDINWYNENKNEDDIVIISNNDYYFDVYFNKIDSEKYCGKTLTITDISDNLYIFDEMGTGFYYCDEMIECKVE